MITASSEPRAHQRAILAGPLGPVIFSATLATGLLIGLLGAFPIAVSVGLSILLVTLVVSLSAAKKSCSISLVPIFYIQLTLLSGLISNQFFPGFLNRSKIDSSYWTWCYLSVVIVAILTFLFLRHRGVKGSSGSLQEHLLLPSRPGVAAAILLSAAGVFLIARNLPANYLLDPQAARQMVTLDVTPIQQVLYKLTIPVILVVAFLGLSSVKRFRFPIIVVLGLAGGLALSLYGGRFLALSLVIGLVVLWIRYSAKVRWKVLTVFSLALYIIASIVAAYRYFSFYGQKIGVPEVAVTAASQTSIEFLDGLKYSVFYNHGEAVRDALVGGLLDSVPDFIASRIGLPTSTGAYQSVGALISQSFGQGEVGGIRIGAVGEVSSAFGLLGAVILGLMLGLITKVVYTWESAGGIRLVRAVTASLLTLSVVILGLVSLISAIAVLVLYILLVERPRGVTQLQVPND